MPTNLTKTPRVEEFLDAAEARNEGPQAKMTVAVVGLKGLLLKARHQPLGDLHPMACVFLGTILSEYSRGKTPKETQHLLDLFETAESLFLDDLAANIKAQS